MHTTISRRQRAGWQWPWQRSREDTSCLRLLQALPLRMLQRPGSEAPLLELLAGLADCLRARQALLLLPEAGQSVWRRIGEGHCMGDCPLHAGNTRLPAADSVVLCVDCLRAGQYRLICVLTMEEGAPGALLLEFTRMPSVALRRELAEVGRLLAETLSVLAEDRQQRRRELVAERGVLSRELHDSVAQQLSYLQIRASRLQALLPASAQPEAVGAMLVDLRDTLASLHRQVRELIATARLTMDGCSLRQALEASVEEFSRRSSCVFSWTTACPPSALAMRRNCKSCRSCARRWRTWCAIPMPGMCASPCSMRRNKGWKSWWPMTVSGCRRSCRKMRILACASCVSGPAPSAPRCRSAAARTRHAGAPALE
ncbi:histidine kinase [Pseudomonas aeruginosa]|nr:histidine kinase [Pseudomonas aeruginosa]